MAVRHGRHPLAEVLRAAGELTHGAAAQKVQRFAAGLADDGANRRQRATLKALH
ncbi:MAG TPA: hypothetical protein P5525_02335 [Candidatus Paceibacterota bacterium]|nr:hypothetical protein [Candidatus Paceibacterota bacterium]